MHSFTYFIREALSNSRRNFSTTLGAIVTIFLSLLVIGVFFVASIIINNTMGSLENEVKIYVYINDDATQTDVDALQGYVKGLPEVSDVLYVSKEESLKRFKETADPDFVGQLEGNPLPATIEISLHEAETITAVVDNIKAHETFLRVIDKPEDPNKSVRWGDDYVDSLVKVNNMVWIVSIVLVSLLVFVALIFINNTIRLAIMARRKEIAIMRLVGASNGFIRGPFLMEGALQALVGAGLAIGILALGCNYLSDASRTTIKMLEGSFPSSLELWMIYGALLGVGVIVGLFGSVWAMRRYLKV